MSAGGFVGVVWNLIIFSFVYSVCGLLIDSVIHLMMMYPSGYFPMDAINTVNNLHLIYVAIPIAVIISTVINYIVITNSESGGNV